MDFWTANQILLEVFLIVASFILYKRNNHTNKKYEELKQVSHEEITKLTKALKYQTELNIVDEFETKVFELTQELIQLRTDHRLLTAKFEKTSELFKISKETIEIYANEHRKDLYNPHNSKAIETLTVIESALNPGTA